MLLRLPRDSIRVAEAAFSIIFRVGAAAKSTADSISRAFTPMRSELSPIAAQCVTQPQVLQMH